MKLFHALEIQQKTYDVKGTNIENLIAQREWKYQNDKKQLEYQISKLESELNGLKQEKKKFENDWLQSKSYMNDDAQHCSRYSKLMTSQLTKLDTIGGETMHNIYTAYYANDQEVC